MNILGLETSSIVCSVGLTNERGFTVERSLIDPHIHSEKLLTLISDVLKQAELSLQNIDAVAVSIGPGSFTGLRIGLSTAKGLCFSLDKPLVAVPTFDAVARLAWDDHAGLEAITIALDAKQGDFYVASQARKRRGLPLRAEISKLDPDEIRARDAGDGHSAWITDRTDVLVDAGVSPSRVLDYILFCGGRTVAGIGLEKYRVQEFADVTSVEPMYLKEFIVKQAPR
ncbi:MAG TPA: tRNA (adenosine(37)-N6)-threonylcarbamoyltransferase complex dimerization subunit type 1 TsaB [Bacteroidota bacterium]|nr:tRNA (adenosine(37)-N6)-threonylcarbamoyltransferase complex dimerization subunit type 1 TsaB [Bacteroidota bacterium]